MKEEDCNGVLARNNAKIGDKVVRFERWSPDLKEEGLVVPNVHRVRPNVARGRVEIDLLNPRIDKSIRAQNRELSKEEDGRMKKRESVAKVAVVEGEVAKGVVEEETLGKGAVVKETSGEGAAAEGTPGEGAVAKRTPG
nr:hypothetical protein Iba_chr01cCG4590 [Ipomoea batatas]